MTACIQQKMLGWSCALVVLAGAWSTGRGAEPFTEFLDGLRRREMFDMATAYLEQMQSSSLVTDEQKQTIPYELGRTVLDEARATRDTQLRLKRLDEARGYFEQFLKAHPQHSAAADAATQLGGLLVERGKTLLEIANRPNQAAQKDELTKQARDLFAEATKVFNDAEARFEEALTKFPKVIDPKDRRALEARNVARADVMRARLWSGMVLYESSKAYPPDSADAKRLLTESAAKFEDMYKKNGQYLPGLYARLWQARSLLELDETSKSLLYLGELMVKPNTSEELRALRRKTVHLSMQGYLHEKEKKYDKAIEEGDKWLQEARGTEDRTAEGLAIRWYLAQAHLLLGRSLPDGDRGKSKELSAAASEAAQVAKYPGEFQKDARALVAELRDLDGAAPEAQTFAEARTAGREALDEISALDSQIRTAQATHKDEDKIPAWQEQRTAALQRALEQFLLAIRLRDSETTIDQVNEVRYFLTYIYYLQERNYDGAVMGEFLAQRYPQHASAKSAAKIALACWVKAYNALPPEKRQ
ncbi:MAG: tol-pal system YbgF family protein, partial [Pirellulales bacterium]